MLRFVLRFFLTASAEIQELLRAVCGHRQDDLGRMTPAVTNRTPRRSHQIAQTTSEGRGATSTNLPEVRSWNRTHSDDQ